MRVAAEHFPWQSHVQAEIDARGWELGEFAFIAGLTLEQVDGLLSRGEFAPSYPAALARAFGTSAEVWSNLFLADLEWEAANLERELGGEA